MRPRKSSSRSLSLPLVLAAGCFASLARPAAAQLVINEIEYDQPGTDSTEFVELKNTGPSALSLQGYTLKFINGANNSQYNGDFNLPAVLLGAGQYYVLCGNASLAGCDRVVLPATDAIQNGSPDALGLFLNGALVDALSYEGNVPGFVEGTGAGSESGSTANQGLSRCVDGFDSDHNSTDFQLRPNTPGSTNACDTGGGPPFGACGDPATLIGALQGSGTLSPLLGQTVIIEGIVVGDFQDTPLGGFFVQEEDGERDGNPASSEGVFVFQGATPGAVAAGQRVRVRGQVSEFDSLTELSGVTDIATCPSAGVASAEPLAFPVAAVADLERYEGMLVQIDQPLTVSGNFEWGRFGSLDLSVGGRLLQPTQVADPGPDALALQDLNDRSRIVLDDASTTQNPDPIPYKDADSTRRVGSTLPELRGVLDGRFGVYRIQPTSAPAFADDNPRVAAPPDVGGRLKAASFNVLNFFTTLDTGAAICGPSGTLDCRGANSQLEFDRQRSKLIHAIAALDADVVGLTEIENNPSTATRSLVDGLNALLGAGTYAFVDTGTIGTDAIKLAFIYQPAKVAAEGSFALLTSSVDPDFIDTKNRPSLAQTFRETSSGGRVTLVVNHLKSKGSACTDVGDPDAGDGQGNCNGTRTRAAGALLRWIAADPTHSGDPDYLILGDLNAYAKEDPLTTLVGGGFAALLQSFGGQAAYSYQFAGQSGSLDHALANAALVPQVTGAAEWHINADEPTALDYNTEFKTDDPFDAGDSFRASDHDPVLVGLDLTPAAAPVPASSGPLLLVLALLLLGVGRVLARRGAGPGRRSAVSGAQ